jgi:peptidoglycan/LPS O-acetylase OafA/YrhL
MVQTKRLEELDGFRAVAIILVIGFHYFSRWTPTINSVNLYPYGNIFAKFPLFKYGYVGVELFFIISGFVICLTLFQSNKISEFYWKRFSRLFPTMLLCSLITISIESLLPIKLFQIHLNSLLPSLTFVDPIIFSKIFGSDFHGVDGSYWSLFIEVKFYIIMSVLYFLSKRNNFSWYFFLLFISVELGYFVTSLLGLIKLNKLINLLFFIKYLPFFAGGVGFYFLFFDKIKLLYNSIILTSLFFIIINNSINSSINFIELFFYLLFYLLFYLFIFRRPWLSPFSWKPMTMIGAASYSLYLLHQDLGITIIAVLGNLFNFKNILNILLIPFFVIFLMIISSLYIYKIWEVPSKSWILLKLKPMISLNLISGKIPRNQKP